jgi:hypothetical protein
MAQIKGGNAGDVPSFFRDEHRGAVLGLVRDVCGNDHEFRACYSSCGDLDLSLAHREFTAEVTALRPDLIEEVVVAQAPENQGGSGGSVGRLTAFAAASRICAKDLPFPFLLASTPLSDRVPRWRRLTKAEADSGQSRDRPKKGMQSEFRDSGRHGILLVSGLGWASWSRGRIVLPANWFMRRHAAPVRSRR